MSKETIVIIDYGSGNLRSAAKAFEHVVANEALDVDVRISGEAEDVLAADRLVLPGQGAFGDCLENLQNTDGMIEALNEAVLEKGKPFLGICVGMQLLATKGLENGEHAGLDWVPGTVLALKDRIQDKDFKIPHMGWNVLSTPNEGAQDNRHFVLRSTESSETGAHHYYFVHSYMFECEYNHHILATAEYGTEFAAVVGRDNIVGVQFHPEKSQAAGLRLISDFVHWKP